MENKNRLASVDLVAIIHECTQVSEKVVATLRDEIAFLKESVRAERENTKLAVSERDEMRKNYESQIKSMREQLKLCHERYDRLVDKFHLENDRNLPKILNDNRVMK